MIRARLNGFGGTNQKGGGMPKPILSLKLRKGDTMIPPSTLNLKGRKKTLRQNKCGRLSTKKAESTVRADPQSTLDKIVGGGVKVRQVEGGF